MNYKVIEIFTSESARFNGKPLYEAVVEHVRKQKLAARCIVTRGLAGCYENGVLASEKIEVLSYQMPVKVEIVLPGPEADRILPAIAEMVTDGIVAVRDLHVVSHTAQKHLLPIHLLVRDVMTAGPQTLGAGATAGDAARLLLSADFNAVPVVDDANRPLGIITQGDLIARAGMPVRLGLLGEVSQDNVSAVLAALHTRKAVDIMSKPVVTIAQDQPLTAAVDLMLARDLKRLPVTDAAGRLAGMLARVDIFRTITTQGSDQLSAGVRQIAPAGDHEAQPPSAVSNTRDLHSTQPGAAVPHSGACPVRDIMRRDMHTVHADATVEEVMRVIDSNDIQRVAVVDAAGKLAGMISDRDLLGLFTGNKASLWDRIAGKLTFTEMGKRHHAVVEQARKRTAGEIMKTDLVTVQEDASIEAAIALMADRQIKRLPVVGPDGVFKGMVSRDSVLRAAMAGGHGGS